MIDRDCVADRFASDFEGDLGGVEEDLNEHRPRDGGATFDCLQCL